MIAPNNTSFSTTDAAKNWFPVLLWKSRWLIAFTAVLGICSGFLFLQIAPNTYESGAQILVMRRGVDLGAQRSERNEVGYHEHVDSDEFVTQMLIVRSPEVVRQAVKLGKLNELPQFAEIEDPTWNIIGGIDVTRGLRAAREAKVLNVNYTGDDPQACQRIVHAIALSYQTHLNSIYDDVSGNTIRLITKARDDLHTQLVSKEAAYLVFRKDAPIFNTGNAESKTLHEGSLTELARTRADLFVRQAELRAHIASIQNAANNGDSQQAVLLMLSRTGISTTADNDMATVYERELLTLEIDEQLLLEQYGKDHPIVAAQQRKIQAIEKFMQRRKLLGRRSRQFDDQDADFIPVYLASKQQELRELETLDSEISKSFKSEQTAAQSSVVYTIQDATLRHEIDRIKRLYEHTLAQLERISLVKDYGGYYTQVITPPGLGRLAWPKPHFVYLAGAAVGAFVGIGLALLGKFLCKGFRDASSLEQATGVEVIGQIPALPRHKLKPGQPVSSSLVVFNKPHSVETESFRAFRTSLLFGTRIDGPRVVHLVAPQSGVDASSVLANLGVTLARAGRRVLIVDANLSRPMQHELFACHTDTGLVDLATGLATSDAVQATAIDNLRVLATGRVVGGQPELFSSAHFQELLSHLRQEYDYILIDSAPLLESTDATSIAANVDAVVLVARVTKTPRTSVQQAIDVCERVAANVIGVLLTSVGKDQLKLRHTNSSTKKPKRSSSRKMRAAVLAANNSAESAAKA